MTHDLRPALLALALLAACRPRPADYVVDAAGGATPATLRVSWGRRDALVAWSPGLGVEVDGARLPVPCDAPFTRELPAGRARGLLAVDPGGRRVAARCHPDDGWKVFHAAGDAGFMACAAGGRAGPSVDWSREPTLEAAALAGVACGSVGFVQAQRAVERRAGAAGLGRLLRATARSGLGRRAYGPDSVAPEDAFVAALARVPPADRDAIARDLLTVITPGGDDALLPRALRSVDLARPELTPAVLDAALTRCRGSVDDGCTALRRRYALVAPVEAARRVCDEAGGRTDFDIGPTRLAIMARGGARCEAWAARVEAAGCAVTVGGRTCPGAGGAHPCSADEYRAEVDAELRLRAGDAYPEADGFGHANRVLTAAARAMGLACAGPRIDLRPAR